MMQFILLLCLIVFGQFSQANNSAELKTINVNVSTTEGVLRTEIHFSQKDLAVARRVEQIIQTDLTKAVEYFHHIPRDIVHFNIDPYKRLTNGNATIFPTNIINLYNFPASNLEHLISLEDWLQGLMFHEFIHVIHLDQTNGFLEDGRNIFGTIAKVPVGIVPRWFTEGIAVWAESHFLEGGRLKNELLNKDLWLKFHDNKFCSFIDCLDEPGVYPHGQLAYWAGGHFMNYLENKKANTIRCLVFENSKKFPLFLNDVFLTCTGATAQDLFQEFRAEYLKKFDQSLALNESGENIFGAQDFQKGSSKSGNILFRVERQKNKAALVRYDLALKTSTFHIYSEPIVHLGDLVQLDGAKKGLLVAFNDDPQFVIQNKAWKIINTDSLLEEKSLSFAHDPSYVIPLAPDSYLIFSYEENHWRAYKDEKLIREWPLKYNLVSVLKNENQVILKINTANVGTAIYTADLNLDSISKDGKVQEFGAEGRSPESETFNYPQLEHLKPHYWFFAVGNSNSPSSIGAMTTLSDPMSVHSLSATGLVYPSVHRAGGVAQYTHTDHLWQQYLLLQRDYSTNSWSENLNRADEVLVGTAYQFEMKKWLYTPQFNFGKSSSLDAFSEWQNNYWVFLQSLSYQAMSSNDFWQAMATSIEWGANTQSVGHPYFKLQTRFSLTNNITEDFTLNFKVAYGKLYKNTFADGVLYGGGIGQLQLSRRYEFFGIPYGDAYGNQILSTRLTHDLNFWNIYRGHNFVPLFLKEAHLLFGFETLAADRIFIDRHFYRNENIKSLFVGTKLTTNLFYYVPSTINLIFSSTTTPIGTHVNLVNFFLKLDI